MINKFEIAKIMVRILAAYLFLQSLSILPMYVSIENSTMSLISPSFIIIIFSVILWIFAPSISILMVKDNKISTFQTERIQKHHFEGLIFSSIGLILVVISIRGLAGMIAYNNSVNTFDHNTGISDKLIASSISYTTKHLVEFIMGLLLLFYSDKLSRILNNIRKKIK